MNEFSSFATGVPVLPLLYLLRLSRFYSITRVPVLSKVSYYCCYCKFQTLWRIILDTDRDVESLWYTVFTPFSDTAFSHAISWQWIVSNNDVRPCLSKFQSLFLYLDQMDPVDSVLRIFPPALIGSILNFKNVTIEFFFSLISPRI